VQTTLWADNVGRRPFRSSVLAIVTVAGLLVATAGTPAGAEDESVADPGAVTPPTAEAAAGDEPRVRYDDGPLLGGGAVPFTADGRKWDRTTLTFGFTNTTPDLGDADTKVAVRQALALWEAASGLHFTEVADCGGAYPPGDSGCATPDIRVLFGTGSHGDAFAFDGPGGVLAHAYYPPPNLETLAGDAHFDDSEDWQTDFDLVTAAAHEFGHSLGLAHAEAGQCPSVGEQALMCPFYMGSRPFLGADDIAGIQALYPVEVIPPSPPNDDFAAAQVLAGVSGSTAATTLGADHESGEPAHAGNAGGASVWFTWSPPRSGQATIDTAGSGFDTVLGVYTGPSVTALAPVAANDDHLRRQSLVSFAVTAGTTYRIVVDGSDGVSGPVTLNWSTTCPPHGLGDVPAWVEDAVCWIVAEGHATGYPNGTYGPNLQITRAQVTRMLYRIEGGTPGPWHGLSDVPAWVQDAVTWIIHRGYATGYPGGTYRPNDSITRAQVASMLWKIAGRPYGGGHGLVDVPIWVEQAVRWLVSSGYATGYPDGTFRPDAPITRAEMTRMLFRIYG
jgi:hypothetical protein